MTTSKTLRDWPRLTQQAERVLDGDIRKKGPKQPGLHDYQVDVARHVLCHLASRPGIIVAERTGRGKSLIATAVIAALARACDRPPFRVGLLAPNRAVLRNWTKKLLPGALKGPGDTYLWRESQAPLSWDTVVEGRGNLEHDELQIFAHHYHFGIAARHENWSSSGELTSEHAAVEFLWADDPHGLDLLIVDEAHQLKSSGASKSRALKTLFGQAGCPIPVQRVLALTATPFQLNAPVELSRLIQLLSYPTENFPEVQFGPAVHRIARARLERLVERYVGAIGRWLGDQLGGSDGVAARGEAEARRDEIQAVLREVMVRTSFASPHVKTSYGHPKPDPDKRGLPLPEHGLEIENAVERLLFLAWDGAIASRTTFVSTEQQTLASSAEALRNRHRQDKEGDLSATEGQRTPLAPKKVQRVMLELSKAIAEQVDPDHLKVRRTTAAVRARVANAPRGKRPALVFVERTATLEQLKTQMETGTEACRVGKVWGGQGAKARERAVKAFKSGEVDVLLASKVAEMGLDIDGPGDKEDIWLIHHDFPWNPAMVDQRNGRVYRPAKQTEGEPAPALISYPFVRDTVDERIFKRMLLRQATAELLLGTDEVARTVRLADHRALDRLEIARLPGDALRELCPDLSPGPTATVSVGSPEQEEADVGGLDDELPTWIRSELRALAGARASGPASIAVKNKLREVTADRLWSFYECDDTVMIKVDLGAREHVVAVLVRTQREQSIVETLALADDDVTPNEVLTALRENEDASAAGLVLVEGTAGADLLIARSSNLSETLDDSELRRMIYETARRADAWERVHGGREDRW